MNDRAVHEMRGGVAMKAREMAALGAPTLNLQPNTPLSKLIYQNFTLQQNIRRICLNVGKFIFISVSS